MRWTRTKPTTEGYYFVKVESWDCIHVWLAEFNRDGKLVWDDIDDPAPLVAEYDVGTDEGYALLYAGPIPEPNGYDMKFLDRDTEARR